MNGQGRYSNRKRTNRYQLLIFVLVVFLLGLAAETVFTQETNLANMETSTEKSAGLFMEVDAGLLAFTGGIATNCGIALRNYRWSIGYSHFNAPSKFFSGVPDEFELLVDHIIAVNFAYFFFTKQDKGLYAQLMYHNKKQIVTNKETGDAKDLLSNLVGIELGYVFKFWKGFYLAPRIGALYYITKPQGTDNEPVLIGNKYYDNPRHKTWDTYFIPTLSIGYSYSFKK
jgi:hypothetical protein